MLYVTVGDVVSFDDSLSAGSQMSALLPPEVTQHLDTYDGSLGEGFSSFIGQFYTALTVDWLDFFPSKCFCFRVFTEQKLFATLVMLVEL